MQERRRFKRIDVELPVTLRCGGRLIPATTLNISCGGACLGAEIFDEVVAENDRVEIILDLSKQAADVSLRGEITRVEEGGISKVGIKFTNLYTVGHQTLERFLNRYGN